MASFKLVSRTKRVMFSMMLVEMGIVCGIFPTQRHVEKCFIPCVFFQRAWDVESYFKQPNT